MVSGTWQSAPGEVERAVNHAIGAGYRHIDGACCYQNEDEVGQGIKDAIAAGKAKREDLFVTTKLWCTFHTRVEEALDTSLKKLGLDYLDLFLVHWPLAMNPNGMFETACFLVCMQNLTIDREPPPFPKARGWLPRH